MVRRLKILGLAIVTGIILLAGGIVVYMLISSMLAMDSSPIRVIEDVAVTQVSFDSVNPNIILVNVTVYAEQSVGQKATFNAAIFKEYPSEDIMAIIDLTPVSLSIGENTVLTIDTGDKLTSGQYTVALITTVGGVYYSDPFTKP
jgi:hypothetical protein